MKLNNGEFRVELNGIQHWVKIEGCEHQTRPLIVLHGGPGGNHYTFERTVGPYLSKSRTVVYYEQRGSGRSERPRSNEEYTVDFLIDDFKELQKWLEVDKVDLLGYSFGGELALEMAYALPDEIHHLILSAPSLLNSGIQKLVQIAGFMSVATRELFSAIQLAQQEATSIDELYDRVGEMVDTDVVDRLLFENQDCAKKNRDLWEESGLDNTGFMAKALQKWPADPPLLSRLNDIAHQTLIIAGVFDRNTGVPVSKIIHRELVNSQLVLFEKSAHFPDLEETEKFVQVVHAFLEK
ncbi:MAG TPA: alpha/beta fold hydrolase [Sporolactobacillaceae bacterium]|nr:alpha/beta fold hydrolase [Sporolactobacillaceae bacterium]